jgi:hypothetical protein
MMFWRFLPPYVTDPKKFKLDTNAKGETLLDSNTWRYAFLHSRCLVPVDSFIEWKRIACDGRKALMMEFLDELSPPGGRPKAQSHHAYLRVPLSSIDHGTAELGRIAGELALELAADPEQEP